MCMGTKTQAENEADQKAMQERKAIEHSQRDGTSSDGPAPRPTSSSTLMRSSGSSRIRPGDNSSPTRRRNAYNPSTRRRNNPTLLQSILDTSVTYNAAKYIGRRFDPRG